MQNMPGTSKREGGYGIDAAYAAPIGTGSARVASGLPYAALRKTCRMRTYRVSMPDQNMPDHNMPDHNMPDQNRMK